MVGANLADLFPLAFSARARQFLGDGEVREEVYLDRPGGGSWWAALVVRPLSAPLEGYVLTFLDVTRERDTREVQRYRRDVLEQARRTESATRRRGELLSGITHDLRTPITTILGFAEMLHSGKLGPMWPAHRESVGDIYRSAQHLSRLVEDTLDLGRLEAGKLEIRPVVFSLLPALESARMLAGEGGARVDIDAAPDLGDARLDPDRFRQIVLNFLTNALKFSPPPSRVRLRARGSGTGDWIRVEVEDDGPGIDPLDIPGLFTEYRRIERPGQRATPGTGLGLALTRRLAEVQGGRVGVRRAADGGSVFFAVLPRRPRSTTGPRPGSFRTDEPVILVVEPSADRVGPLVATLGAHGLRPRIAESGEAALELGQVEVFDAYVLPVLLPDMTGLDVLRSLRNELGTHEAPIILATPTGDFDGAAEHGIFAVVRSPAEPADILEALRRCGIRVAPG
jgi:signal transduction histidine kinase